MELSRRVQGLPRRNFAIKLRGWKEGLKKNHEGGTKCDDAAAAKRLPTVYGYREHVDVGGLISYGVNLDWCFHRSAFYVDKVLKGAKPADLPVEFPSRLHLALNLKTAKALGLDFPLSLLARADEVIE